MNKAAIVKSQTDVIRLEGMDCADCAAKLEKRIAHMPGVEEVRVSFGTARMDVVHTAPVEEILAVVGQMGYKGRLGEAGAIAPAGPFWSTNQYARSTVLAGSVLLTALILDYSGALSPMVNLTYLLCIVLGGFLPARAGWAVLRHAGELDMNVLMAVAVMGAAFLGDFQEGAVVVFLFALGNALQARAMDKTRSSIRALMNQTPDKALVRRMGLEMFLPVDKIQVGDTVIVRPGERIPMDGQVIAGSSTVDQAVITGESLPVFKQAGDEVYAGTINSRGALEIEVSHTAQYNKLARIIHLVEEAQGQRAPSQQLIERFARWYTPLVIGLAVLIAIFPPLILHQPWQHWLYQAMALLLVACPCALVISAPVSIVSAIGAAARQGVLIKGGTHLEQAGSLSVIAFDKTGTLTLGKPTVTDLIAEQADADTVLAVAAAIESRSEHPLAQAIMEAAHQRNLPIPLVTDFESRIGQGASGRINGKAYLVGSCRMFADYPIPARLNTAVLELQQQGKTIILIGSAQELLGLIAVADVLRPDSRAAVAKLKRYGIERVVMLTGDNAAIARDVAAQTGVDEFTAELMPEDKVQAVRNLLSRYGKVGMVGDGVNDAPALAVSTVGIAMGTAGTDVALETADIALMADDLSKLAYTVHLSRQTVRVMKQNITFAMLFKLLIMLLAVPGWLTLWLAVVGDMGTSLLVTLNGMRLLWVREKAE